MAPDIHDIALGDHRRKHFGQHLVDTDATMGRRIERHFFGSMNGNAIVEVPRIGHAAQRADSLAVVKSFESEHAAWGFSSGTELPLDRRVKFFTIGIGVKLAGLAELLGLTLIVELTRRNVGNQRRNIGGEDDEYLLGQIDLDVGRAAAISSPWLHGDRILHPLPHLVGDRPGRLEPWSVQY